MVIPSGSAPNFVSVNSFHGYFVPHSKKEQSIHTLVFLLLEFHVFWDPDIAISCEAMPMPSK